MGLAFRLLVSDSIKFSSSPVQDESSKTESSVVHTLPVEDSGVDDYAAIESEPSVSTEFAANENQTLQTTAGISRFVSFSFRSFCSSHTKK